MINTLVHEAVEEACKRNPRLVLEPYNQIKAAALILAEKILQLAKELEQEQASHAETRQPCRNTQVAARDLRDLEAAEKYFGITHPTPAPCSFYEALDKHVRDGVIAAAVDIGRHHQKLIRNQGEKET